MTENYGIGQQAHLNTDRMAIATTNLDDQETDLQRTPGPLSHVQAQTRPQSEMRQYSAEYQVNSSMTGVYNGFFQRLVRPKLSARVSEANEERIRAIRDFQKSLKDPENETPPRWKKPASNENFMRRGKRSA